ncbi:cytochrome P450 52A1 [Aureobasidium sp. EXF-3400]|nr:cytochrome P450 52A1 [Aureobasidium sp. EXF-12344]KAI4775791.1 cytochrome P450 52A1 [Aureobasidium sp. EXF-3400]
MLFSKTPHPVTVVAIGTLLVGSFVYVAFGWWKLRQSRQELERVNKCLPPRGVYRNLEPFIAFDMILSLLSAARKKKMLEWFDGNFQTYGPTFVVRTIPKYAVHTIEADNIKTAYSLKFEDWSVRPARQSFKHLMDGSTFMSDGAAWSHSRGILRPMFVKDRITDLDLYEAHFQKLLKLIPEDGSTFDLGALFHRYAFDVSSEFLFGESLDSLGNQTDAKAQLAHDIELTIQDAADRFRKSLLYRWLKRPGVDQAVNNVLNSTTRYAQKALERAAEDEKRDGRADENKHSYSFLDEMARQTQDLERMSHEATSLMFAGKDTTAGLLGSMWYLFARHPEVWSKLLAEVDQLEGAPPTYEWVKNAKYLRYCEHEAMRLYPVTPILPPRIANKNTVLPLGGGKDGKSPLFVPKGTALIVNIYSANRRREVYGDDADEFRPERWEDLRPGWAYTPFGGGPRICVGQQFAITEVYYLTVRLMQHFRRVECRDSRSFQEDLAGVILCPDGGVQVGLYHE